MKKQPITKLMEYMEQNQYFIGNDLLAKYKELLEDTEWNETIKNSACQNHALEQEEQELWDNTLLDGIEAETWEEVINDCIMKHDASNFSDVIECLKKHYKAPELIVVAPKPRTQPEFCTCPSMEAKFEWEGLPTNFCSNCWRKKKK